MSEPIHARSRSARLDHALAELLRQTPEVEAAAVVSFDGLPMASALPSGMDEDRVAAMSAALLSLGERAAESFGRGVLSQVYVEGEHGTVFLVSADDEAVLVAVGARGAKVGLVLYEVRRAAAAVAHALRADDAAAEPVAPPVAEPVTEQVAEPVDPPVAEHVAEPVADVAAAPAPAGAPSALAAVAAPSTARHANGHTDDERATWATFRPSEPDDQPRPWS